MRTPVTIQRDGQPYAEARSITEGIDKADALAWRERGHTYSVYRKSDNSLVFASGPVAGRGYLPAPTRSVNEYMATPGLGGEPDAIDKAVSP
jgi:hypothetical protein